MASIYQNAELPEVAFVGGDFLGLPADPVRSHDKSTVTRNQRSRKGKRTLRYLKRRYIKDPAVIELTSE